MAPLKSQLQQLDTQVFLWVQAKWCKKSSMPLIRAVSFTGDGWFYAAIAVFTYLLQGTQGLPFIYCCLLAYALQVPAYMLLKQQFKRDRPQEFLMYFTAKIKPSDQFSFPSGHTAAAFVMASELVVYYPVFGLFAISWACLIGLSRVLLGVHFPGDILAGATLGIICTSLANNLLSLTGAI